MTSTTSDPWDELHVPVHGQISRRRVDSETPYALYWTRDDSGRPGLMIEVSNRLSLVALKGAKFKIRQISTDVLDFPHESFRALVVRLESTQHSDVFLKLCLDLIEVVTESTDNSEHTFPLILQRLRKWQALLSARNGNLLTVSEIQGLFSELSFIAEALTQNRGLENLVIRGWEGPEKTQHDFVLNETAVEIKSIAGNSRGKVKISSEDQLDTHLARMFLRVYFLTMMIDCEGGVSLNALVTRIRSMIVSPENRDRFEELLTDAGYIDIPNYNTPCFQINERRTYSVKDGFPRITRNLLPDGVDTVTYHISLATIEKFKVDAAQILGDVQ